MPIFRCFACFIAALALGALSPAVSFAGGKPEATKTNPNAPQKGGEKKFILPCPGGTESTGEAPPNGNTMYCRQPVKGGGYVKTGDTIRWYDNGKKRFEGEYVRDKKHGDWVSYHRNGKKKTYEEWYNGARVKSIRYDRHGKIVKSEETPVEEVRKRQKKDRPTQNLTRKGKGQIL